MKNELYRWGPVGTKNANIGVGDSQKPNLLKHLRIFVRDRIGLSVHLDPATYRAGIACHLPLRQLPLMPQEAPSLWHLSLLTRRNHPEARTCPADVEVDIAGDRGRPGCRGCLDFRLDVRRHTVHLNKHISLHHSLDMKMAYLIYAGACHSCQDYHSSPAPVHHSQPAVHIILEAGCHSLDQSDRSVHRSQPASRSSSAAAGLAALRSLLDGLVRTTSSCCGLAVRPAGHQGCR